MEILFSLLLYLPGALELTLLLLVFFAVIIYHRQISWLLVSRAVFYTTLLLWAGIVGAQSTSGTVMPLQWLTYFVITLVAYVLLNQKKPLWHKLSLPVIAAIYSLCVWQFTFVRKEVVVSASWELGEAGKKGSGNPEETLVSFKFQGEENTAIYSDQIASYLRHKTDSTAAITLDLLYHWGRFAGHNLKAVDGRTARFLGGYGSVGCKAVCNKYYFGLRGF